MMFILVPAPTTKGHCNMFLHKFARNRRYRIGRIILITIIIVLLFIWCYFPADCKLSFIRQLLVGECVHINETIKLEVNKAKAAMWKTIGPKLTITLFTTFDTKMQQNIVHENTLRNWKQLPNVETILFYCDKKTKELGKKFNWTLLPVPKYSCGAPVLRDMLEVAQNKFDTHFYGFANADILFSSDLIRTLEEVVESKQFDYGPILLTGKRIDVNLSSLPNMEIDSEDDFFNAVNHGQLAYDMAADYFITNQLFLWKYIPDVVVGRPIIDNWIIWYSRIINSKIIDLTSTSPALHQRANGFIRKVNECNHGIARKAGLLPRIPIWKGSIGCSSHISMKNIQNKIIFVQKSRLSLRCYWRKITYER